MKHIFIDAGHGGLKDGVYQVIEEGSKQYKFDDGFTIYEGVVNRSIALKTIDYLENDNIKTIKVYDDVLDTPISDRVKTLYNHLNKNINGYLLSIHNNAGGGTGTEVFSTRKNNLSDEFAKLYVREHLKKFKDIRMRGHKETNYKIIRESPYFGILVEGLFMDYRPDAEKMVTEKWQKEYAEVLYNSCKKMIENYG